VGPSRDLLNTLAAMGAANATFRSLHDAWADTTTPHGRLILTVLGGLAEFERHLIAVRIGEGRKRARANGMLFGRPRKLTPHQAREALKRVESGEVAARDRAELQRRSFDDQSAQGAACSLMRSKKVLIMGKMQT